MKTGTPNHIKTKRLARKLKLPLYSVVGILETLWHLTADCADDGGIGRHSNEEIAAYLEWGGDCDELVDALVSSGWLDAHPLHRLIVHDWMEHAPKFIKDRVSKRKIRTYVSSESDKRELAPRVSAGVSDKREPESDTRGAKCQMSPLTQPIPTQPNPTNPNPTNLSPGPATVAEDSSDDGSNELSIDPEYFLGRWNDSPGAVSARSIKGSRLKHFRARCRDPSWDWGAALGKFPLTCFSSDPAGWQPNIDWFLRPETVGKILEGAYDWKKATNGKQPEPDDKWNAPGAGLWPGAD
jgi:hypothetical protein